MATGEVNMEEDTYNYSKIDTVFKKYANLKDDMKLGGERNRIGPNGMQKLLNDINVPADNINALILAWKFDAKVQCEFSQDEFRQGFRSLGVETTVQLKNKVSKLVDELKNHEKMNSFYRFTFVYAKSASSRHLDIEMAIIYWKLVLDRFFSSEHDNRLQMWYMFLKSNNVQHITQDTWNLLLPFLWESDSKFAKYDPETSSWPVLIDDYVQYCQAYTSETAMDQS
ncbi:DCN1-like protein 1 [Aphelenchoides bicaudatus]|nr:DCN1-like protein 1 [Aphelenchoides bicaudatus]